MLLMDNSPMSQQYPDRSYARYHGGLPVFPFALLPVVQLQCSRSFISSSLSSSRDTENTQLLQWRKIVTWDRCVSCPCSSGGLEGTCVAASAWVAAPYPSDGLESEQLIIGEKEPKGPKVHSPCLEDSVVSKYLMGSWYIFAFVQ